MSQKVKSFRAGVGGISFLKLAICLSLTVGLGQLAMWLSGAWQGYEGMNVSSLAPTAYLMGIVWSVMYILMGASLYAVLDHEVYTIRSGQLKNTSIALWIAQFALLLTLPFLLFSQNLYMLTFVVSSLITAIVASLSIINLKITTSASVLLVPYLAWMVFESYLALVIVLNNF